MMQENGGKGGDVLMLALTQTGFDLLRQRC